MARAREGDALGLYCAADFAIVRGRDAERVAGRAAAWYFADEIVAIPRPGLEVSGFTSGVRPFNDVRRFGESHRGPSPLEWPPLVWIAAPDVLHAAYLSSDAGSVTTSGGSTRLTFIPKLPLNQSWFDASSAAWFASQPVTLRGTRLADGIEARVLWPEAFRLGPIPAPARTLPQSRTFGEALLALVREQSDASVRFDAATLWQRTPDADWTGKSVLAFVLNGAQGDDDEAHAGHFAVATGRIAENGAIDAWIVNSFYALDVESEKGILAGPVPMMNYQAELNAGQSWYRPTWVLAAVLDDDRAALRVQSGLNRVFLQFWRHQLPYYHPTDNCTSMSIDTLRALGLDMPLLGPTSLLGAWLALPWLIARDRSLAKARISFDYLVTERTRLLPALAIEAVGTALMRLASGERSPSGTLETEIAATLAAIAWLRIPQFPSSRAWGSAPVVSLAEYRRRLPADRSKLRIVAVPSRPFPDALRDPDLLPPLPPPSDLAIRLWSLGSLAAIAAIAALRPR